MQEEFRRFLASIDSDPSWIKPAEDAVLANVACKLESLAEEAEPDGGPALDTIIHSVKELNRAKALGAITDK